MVLVATSCFAMLTLSLWLTYWLFFIRPDLNVLAIWIGPSPASASDLGLSFQKQDATIFGAMAVKRPESPDQTADLIRQFLRSKGQRPAIVYLSVPAVGLPHKPGPSDPIDDPDRLSVDPDVLDVARAQGHRATGMNLKDVLEEFRQRPWQKKLLILDIGQIGTDRDLGVFANDFSYRLKQDLDRSSADSLAVLCSCAPGQLSWSSDADRRSVFAHFVAEGMNRSIDVNELAAYVKKHVYQWVKAHRGAIQTPLSWVGSASNFLLPKPANGIGLLTIGSPTAQLPDSLWKRQEAQGLWKRLVACYRRSDIIAEQKPYRYAPLAWREYLETVLRAERLYRAGLFQEGGDAIKSMDRLEQELKNPFSSFSQHGYPSVEMGLRIASDSAFHPQWGTDSEWERALAWPAALTGPVLPDKSKPSDVEKKQGGGIVSSEISGRAEAVATEKRTSRVPEILGMILDGKNPWTTFVEGQLVDWAIEWTRRHPNPGFLSERLQADVFCNALRVRRLAEKAASASWQFGTWSEDLLHSGDEARRHAQDALFLGDRESDAVSSHLEQAKIAYERAIKYGNAQELIQQIRVEWPFLGDWKIRRTATSGQREVLRTAEFIGNFAKKVVKLESRLDASDGRDSATDARIAEFEREYETVRQDFEQLKDEFKSVLDAQSVSLSWREIDDLLRVPMIPSAAREQLVETAVERALDDALQPRPQSARAASGQPEAKQSDSKSEVKQSNPKLEAKQSDSKSKANQRDGKSDAKEPGGKAEAEPLHSYPEQADDSLRDTSSTESMPGPEDDLELVESADESFWALASGMALLEWSSLAIANVQDVSSFRALSRKVNQPLGELYEEITTAGEVNWKSDPAKAYEHYDRIAATLRDLRSRLIESCTSRADGLGELEELWDENYRNRLFLQRALIAMPRPQVDEIDLRARVKYPRFAKLSQGLADFNLWALFIQHVHRLLDDFDLNRAAFFLKLAEGLGHENSEVLKVRQSLESMRAAGIKVSGPKVVLDGDTHTKDMEVVVEPLRLVPKGRAVLFLEPLPIKGLQVLRKDAHGTEAHTTLEAGVQVAPDDSPGRIGYIIQRGIDVEEQGIVRDRERAEKSLTPSLFYRGHTYRTTEPINIVLEPLNDVVYVTVRQDRQFLPRGLRDQFRAHPDEGYMHYNEDLRYELILTNLKSNNQEVFVESRLEQDAESERHETVVLKGRESKVVFRDAVRGVDLKKLGQKAPKSREVDLGRPRQLDVTVWDSPARGRRLAARRIRFNHVDIDAYAAMVNVYYQNEVVYLLVRHLGTDPGKGYIDNVIAKVAGVSQPATDAGNGEGKMCKIGENDYYVFWFGVDPKAPMVKWSVSIGMKGDAFGASLTINPEAKEKEKEKEQDKGAQAPRL
jgi:hypothetical protein